MKQNIREVCFHDICETRGKNNGYASKTLNSERPANPQALEEVRTGSARGTAVTCSFWFHDPTHISLYHAKENGTSSDGRRDRLQKKKKKNLDFSDSSHPHTWASALTKKSPPQIQYS